MLKWHSLLKVHLAINESTSARVQLKLENALLARFWTLKVQVTPSKEKGKMSSSHSLIGWCIVYVDLVFGVAIGGGRCIARAIDCIVVVGNAVEFISWLSRMHGRSLELVEGKERKIPLTYHWVPDQFLNDALVDLAKGDDYDKLLERTSDHGCSALLQTLSDNLALAEPTILVEASSRLLKCRSLLASRQASPFTN